MRYAKMQTIRKVWFALVFTIMSLVALACALFLLALIVTGIILLIIEGPQV